MKWSRILVIVAAGLVGGVICSGLLLLVAAMALSSMIGRTYSSTYLSAQYKEMQFSQSHDGKKYDEFGTPVSNEKTKSAVAKIYIRSKATGKTYYLPDMTVKEVSEVAGLALHDKKPMLIEGEEVYVIGLRESVSFRNGRLTSFYIRADSYTPWHFEIGPKEDGEFLTLPAPVEEVHQLFGRPLGYKRYSAGGI